MQAIDSPDGLFHDGNPATGAMGTIVSSAWLNAVQGELKHMVEGLGGTLDPARNDQVITLLLEALGNKPSAEDVQGAIRGLVEALANKADKSTTMAGYGISDGLTKAALDSRAGTAGGFTFRNRLINAAGTINQRGYVSGTATKAANQYTVDRWRVVVSGQSLSWGASGVGITFTAPAGGVEQVIEGAHIEGGSYTLSWTGTATAKVNGAAVVNGGTVTLPANTNATVTFAGGTFAFPQLEPGTASTAFELRPTQIELALCQRYYEKSYPLGVVPGSNVVSIYACAGAYFESGSIGNTFTWGHFYFKTLKRASPTVTCYSHLGSPGRVSYDYNSTSAELAQNSVAIAGSRQDGFSVSNQSGSTATLYGSTNYKNVWIHWVADAEL